MAKNENVPAPFAATGGGVSILDGFNAMEAARPKTQSGTNFLTLGKESGLWTYGQSHIEVEDGSKWAINPETVQMGFVDWKGGRPVGERMAVIGTPPVDPSALPPAQGPKGWEDQVGFELQCTSGEDEGTAVLYKTTSLGGTRAFNAIFDAIKARAAAGKSYIPEVTLKSDSYVHGDWGKVSNPIFEVVGWMGDGAKAVSDQTEEDMAETEEEAPTRRRRRG